METASKYRPYIADFYCREKQLAIEIDGLQHLENAEYDLEREKYFLALGIKTLRFWNYEIDNDFQKVKNKIMEELQKMPDQEDPLKVIFK